MENLDNGTKLMQTIIKLNNIIAEYDDFLERIESTTTDENTANKLKEFLIKHKVWN